ncbi:MAG TPA: OmpA family protein [Spirochaetota bacterium]|nr:OmpA family protein [Spirochaetota bacterium]HPF07001.1 OmpA family protein [Spirochaetota bacterium]HPJ41449.1 OmpA family protein [Spirochaetota bacterium]HPR36450.1 OmpA family protein [Spirochaetota bacterium]HRX49446.1 OmpA family protein [Spirochaetota bacterium]
MKKLIFLAALLLLPLVNANAVRLEWDIDKNERIEMVKTAGIKYFVNSGLKRVYEERNIIDLTCTDKSDRLNRVNGLFSIHEREFGEDVFKLKEKFMVDFLIEPNGHFVVKKKDYMPNLRHIPTFPDRELNPEDTWTANGELVIDNFSRPFSLAFPVEYQLVRIEDDKDKKIAVINYAYIINMNLAGGNYPADFPVKIAAQNNGVLYWDITARKPKDIQDRYKIVFVFASGGALATAEFHMNIKTKNSLYKNFTEDEKKKEKDELNKELPDGVDADIDKRGIVVRMGDLLFNFDSYEIRKDTEEKLRDIAEILKKKYPDREIIVEGHTDNVGKRSYNYSLSEKRAKKVSEYLKSKLGHDKFSYRGFGQDQPLTDNTTAEGRSKNRRVEIIIKLN